MVGVVMRAAQEQEESEPEAWRADRGEIRSFYWGGGS